MHEKPHTCTLTHTHLLLWVQLAQAARYKDISVVQEELSRNSTHVLPRLGEACPSNPPSPTHTHTHTPRTFHAPQVVLWLGLHGITHPTLTLAFGCTSHVSEWQGPAPVALASSQQTTQQQQQQQQLALPDTASSSQQGVPL